MCSDGLHVGVAQFALLLCTHTHTHLPVEIPTAPVRRISQGEAQVSKSACRLVWDAPRANRRQAGQVRERASERAFPVDGWTPLQTGLSTPELQWQSRGQTANLTGVGLGNGKRRWQRSLGGSSKIEQLFLYRSSFTANGAFTPLP